jgi:hypothetical protein
VSLIKLYGLSWPRNEKNLEHLKRIIKGKKGIYVLANGAMPLYVGKGNIAKRVGDHGSERAWKSRYWNYFSWFVVRKVEQGNELESLLLSVLPFFVRSLNRQTGSLGRKNRRKPPDKNPITVKLPKLARGRKRPRRKKKK